MKLHWTAAALFSVLISAGFPAPQVMTYQGNVLAAGGGAVPDGSYGMQFSIFDADVGGTNLWSETDLSVPVAGGLFSTLLGDGTPFGDLFDTSSALWLEVAIDLDRNMAFDPAEVYSPRVRITAVPYATEADSARALQGRPVSATAPTTGELLRWNGTAWEPATALSGANQFPVAILQANPSDLGIFGDATMNTELSLALSQDPEGGVLTYAFDPTGKAVGIPTSFGAAATMTAQFTEVGDHLAAGWVRDGAGAVSRAQALVSVYLWSSTTPDSAGDVGLYASLAVVNGRPAVAYYDVSGPRLKYVRANDAVGITWGLPVTPDSAGNVGLDASLAVVNGHPAIAYYDNLNRDLKYVHANDADGAAWGTPVTPDSAGAVGSYASLAVVNGRPAVAYYDETNGDLKYVRAADADGAAWGTSVTLDSAGDVGQYASLAVVNGRPAVAYYDVTNGDLKYVRANDADGAAWGTPVTPESAEYVGQYASLAVVNGRPAVAYYDATNRDLKYVRANDADGAAWGTPVTPDSAGFVGSNASLAVVNDRPAVAYRDATNRDLKCVRADDADGAAWGTPVTPDSAGDVGLYASLAMVNGRPAIAYYDVTNGDLKYTIPRK